MDSLLRAIRDLLIPNIELLKSNFTIGYEPGVLLRWGDLKVFLLRGAQRALGSSVELP